MPESLPLNNDPINQRAKALLVARGETLYPDILYLLQLLQVCVERNMGSINPDRRLNLLEHTKLLQTWKAASAWALLVGKNPEQEAMLHLEDLEGPFDGVAWRLIHQLNSRLEETVPGYGPLTGD